MKRNGFSLIELVATLAILAILVTAAAPLAELVAKRAKEQELRLALRQIREGIDLYKKAWDEGRIVRVAGETGYPKSLEVLVEGVEDQRDPKKAKVHFLRRIPDDPLAPPGVHGAESWGKRSYASSHDEPKEGDDLFDVFSRHDGRGINGVPYREW